LSVLASFAAYLVAHFAAYVLVVRRLDTFRTERGIFLYHFVSAVIACSSAALAGFLEQEGFGLAGFVIVLSLHGVYSLSFLELWSLAQGGYSLSIIASIAHAEATGVEPDFSGLAAIGVAKQDDRIFALERLELVATSNGLISLTSRGGTIALALQLLHSWVSPCWQQPE
jgi:hypothetical protein